MDLSGLKKQPDHQQVSVVRFTSGLHEEWNDFIREEALNASFLHSRDFYNHNEANELDDESLMFYRKGILIAVLPAALHRHKGELVLHSHPRATYGGLLIKRGLGILTVLQVVYELISYAREKGAGKILICLPFRIFKKEFCDEIDYAFWYYGFRIYGRKLEIAIPLHHSLNELKEFYHRDTLTSIRKGNRHLSVRKSDDFRGFWAILEKCLGERHGCRPVHDLDSIERLRQSVGGENVLLFTAHYRESMVGGIVIFVLNESVLHAQYIAHDPAFQHLRPVNVIIDHVVDWGHRKNYKYLNLGTGNEKDGKINAGLFRFKEGFGGRGVLRETLFLNVKDFSPD